MHALLALSAGLASAAHGLCGEPVLVIRTSSTIAAMPDRRYILAQHRGTTEVWSALTGRRLASAGGKGGALDGRRELVVIGDEVWDLKDARRILKARGKEVRTWVQALSPDGRFVVFGGSASWQVWSLGGDSPAGVVRLASKTRSVPFLALSSDGSLLAVGKDRQFDVYDVRTGESRSSGALAAVWPFKRRPKGFETRVGSRPVEFNVIWEPMNRSEAAPDPRTSTLWVLDWDKDRRNAFSVYRPENGLSARKRGNAVEVFWSADLSSHTLLAGHPANVAQVAFSPDRWSIATADANGEVRLWHAIEGRQTGLCRGGSRPPHSLTFSPDAQFLLASDAEEIRIYAVSP